MHDALEFARSLAAVVLPCTLFIFSLLAVYREGSAARKDDISGLLWTGVCVMVNVIATFWVARVLTSFGPGAQLPAELVQASWPSGFYFFCALALVLHGRGLLVLIASALSRAGAAFRRALGRLNLRRPK